MVGIGCALLELHPEGERVGASVHILIERITLGICAGRVEREPSVVGKIGGCHRAGVDAACRHGAVGDGYPHIHRGQHERVLAVASRAHQVADEGVGVIAGQIDEGGIAAGTHEAVPAVGLVARGGVAFH